MQIGREGGDIAGVPSHEVCSRDVAVVVVGYHGELGLHGLVFGVCDSIYYSLAEIHVFISIFISFSVPKWSFLAAIPLPMVAAQSQEPFGV